MYNGIHKGPKAGLLGNRYKIPKLMRYDELERLTGYTYDSLYLCQEASGALVDNKASGPNLDLQGSVGIGYYRQPYGNIQEHCVRNNGLNSGWFPSANNDSAVFPGTSSFMFIGIAQKLPGTYGGSVCGINTEDATPSQAFSYLLFDDNNLKAQFTAYDGANSKSVVAGVTNPENGAVAMVGGYDAGQALFGLKVAGIPTLYTLAKGTWNGIPYKTSGSRFVADGSVTAASVRQSCAFFAAAKGAQLDNMMAGGINSPFATILRKLGWE